MKQIELTPDLPLETILQQAEHEDVVVMRQGHAVAIIREFDDEDLDWYARERNPEFLASITRAREEVKNGKTVSHDDLKRQLSQ